MLLLCLASCIRVIHICIVAFICSIPFIDVFYEKVHILILCIHAVSSFLILLHWIFNSNICGLTIIEKQLRNLINDNESLIHSIVSPIYDYPKENEGSILILFLRFFVFYSCFQLFRRRYELLEQIQFVISEFKTN